MSMPIDNSKWSPLCQDDIANGDGKIEVEDGTCPHQLQMTAFKPATTDISCKNSKNSQDEIPSLTTPAAAKCSVVSTTSSLKVASRSSLRQKFQNLSPSCYVLEIAKESASKKNLDTVCPGPSKELSK